MRQKHSHKKHRILTLAAENIAREISNEQVIEEQLQKQNDPQIQQNLQAKQYGHDALPKDLIQPNYQKQNFKQCKIRRFIDINNHSPNHSDIQYIQTKQNYKSYLSKAQDVKTQFKQKKVSSKFNHKKIKTQNTEIYHAGADAVFAQNLKRKRSLHIIQEKIKKVKSLTFKNQSDKNLQRTYDNIQRLRFAQKGIAPKDNYCLLSVSEYLKMTKTLEPVVGNVKNAQFSKPIYHKAIKRPLSHVAKRWYYPSQSNTVRQIDPQSLIKQINFQKRTQRQLNTLNQPLIVSKFSFNPAQDPLKLVQSSIKIEFKSSRPKSATIKRLKEIIQTYENKQFSRSHQKRPRTSKKESENMKISHFRKIKGVKHVKRQKFCWNQLKVESQNLQFDSEKSQQHVFEYPWDWIKFQNIQNVHARQWRS